VYELRYDPEVCAACQTVDCLTMCQYLEFTLEEAGYQRDAIMRGEKCRVLTDCVTCYACEEYCPQGNHPFYRIVDLQEQLGIQPVPVPVTKQQLRMMAPRGQLSPQRLSSPVIDMCFFPMLSGGIQGKLFEGVSTIGGSDLFCNVMWLHFARSSVIRERLPRVIENIQKVYLEPNDIDEIVCFHDECYGTFTHLAPAFGIEVPFKTVYFFAYLAEHLAALRDEIRPLGEKVAYQRPCSNRLIPETQHWVDDIFNLIGAERVKRKYDRENALCCAATIRAMQRDQLADDIQKRNLDDMEEAGVRYCVFNCPACIFSMNEMVEQRGITPIMMSDLCRLALGEG
jgi:Fe-S oxidoreductase